VRDEDSHELSRQMAILSFCHVTVEYFTSVAGRVPFIVIREMVAQLLRVNMITDLKL
jgi:hypothetical protein